MGNIPHCVCIEKRNQILLKSELDINNIEYMKERNQKFEKIESQNNETTLSPQYKFINPLPEIVIIKHKKL